MTSLAAVEELIERERIKAAREAWRAWRPLDETAEWDRDRTRLRLCRPNHPTRPLTATTEWHATLDELAVESLRLARDPRATGRAGFATLSTVITIAGVRRLSARAEELIDDGVRRFGMPDYAAGLRGRLYTMLDRREDARAAFESHKDSSQLDQLHQGYAELLYVVGDFAGAVEQLRRVEGARYRTEALDLEVQVHAASGDDAAALDALDRALAWSPKGSQAAGRLAYRATVRSRLDDLEGARADLVSALAHLEDHETSGADDEMPLDAVRVHVTKRLEALDSAAASSKRRHLTAFPTVVQKWNYCGPAVIELCLRYAGIGLDQDFIAQAVKKGAGTPMHELVVFLREQGIEARRVEATIDVVKASIDLGYPVILEDDYSASRHVVVAIGYDERLGTLTVADPMNHAPIPRGIELRDRLAREHRFAGVVVMGRGARLTADDHAAADRAGLVTPPYLPLLDEAGRSDLSSIPHLATPSALEIVGLTTRVLAQQPAFPAAEAMRMSAAAAALNINSPEFADIASEARVRQPHLAEVPISIAHASRHAGRPYEHTAEASRATQIDPADPRMWSTLGSSLSDIGAWRDAYAAASRALLLHPSEPSALAGLAYILVQECARRALESAHINTVERPALTSLVTIFDKEPWQRLDLPDDVLLPLAEHISYAATHVDDATPGGPAAFSLHLWLSGDHAGAGAMLDKAEQMAPEWTALHVYRLLLAEEHGDLDTLRAVAARLVTMGFPDENLWLSSIESLVRAGLHDDASMVADAAMRSAAQPTTLVEAWVESHCLVSASERLVAEQASALAARLVGHNEALTALADALANRGLRDLTVEVFGRLVDKAPDHLVARHEYAKALTGVSTDGSVVAEAWSNLYQRAPWHTSSLVTWAWLSMKSEPRAVLDRLEGVEESLSVLEVRAAAAHTVGDAHLAAALTARSTDKMSDRADVINLVGEHLELSRFHQAVAIKPVKAPPREDLGLLEMWIDCMRGTGRPHRVRERADLLRPELDYVPIAVAIARIQDGDSPLDEPALKRVAESGSRWLAHWARVRLALRRGDARAAARAAASRLDLLSMVAESTTDATVRREIVAQLAQRAPNALVTWSAIHSNAVWTGNRAAACEAAARLGDEFPADYRAHERAAECDAADGRAATATAAARRATELAPQSARAWEALAWASALQDDWDSAAKAAATAIGFPAFSARGARVILAANSQHGEANDGRDSQTASAFERAVASLTSMSRGGAHSGLIEACRSRVAAAPGAP
jgi:tetratricopeptide (TPR) repeat protein